MTLANAVHGIAPEYVHKAVSDDTILDAVYDDTVHNALVMFIIYYIMLFVRDDTVNKGIWYL